jgi:hypothetical protein
LEPISQYVTTTKSLTTLSVRFRTAGLHTPKRLQLS